jgi:hypothetical protein
MSDDFTRMMQWITQQTAEGLAFNTGSTFDPPNEMQPWRMQPDINLGFGVLPYDKSAFPEIQVGELAEKNPKAMLPDRVVFPNLTTHLRVGLPWRLDAGVRLVNVTVPKGYKLSESTKGDGQINTIGFSIRKHFFGGDDPLLSFTGAYNRVFGHFNFKNEFKDVVLYASGGSQIIADSLNQGRLDWDVRSYGINATVSQVFGRWTPFAGFGFNHMFGLVHGRLDGVWQTPLVSPSVGEAVEDPEPTQGRVLFGAQRDGEKLSYYFNVEVKAIGTQAGKTFIFMAGLAAPFKLGAGNTLAPERRARAPSRRPEGRPGRRIRDASRERTADFGNPFPENSQAKDMIFLR